MAETTLYIKDYFDAFHHEKMMKYKRIDWRKSPILRGTRYRMLMKTRQGREAFLVFCAVADLVVKHKSLGKLVDSDGIPITPEVIEIDTGIPLDICTCAFDLLKSDRFGWFTTDASKVGVRSSRKDLDENSSGTRRGLEKFPKSSLDKRRVDKKRNTPIAPKGADGLGLFSESFSKFWNAYPSHSGRKQDKAGCFEVWKRDGLEAIADRIVSDVEAKKRGTKWTNEGGKYIEGPIVYLRGKRWLDTTEGDLATTQATDWKPAYLALPKETQDAWRLEFQVANKHRDVKPGEFGQWIAERMRQENAA